MTIPAEKKLRLHLFLIGAVFFVNPFVNIVDVLPDFIGCIFFILGIYMLRDLSSYFESARRGIVRYFIVNLSRIPMFLLMFAIYYNNSAQRTVILLFTFTYAVVETIILAFTVSDFFNGMVYIGERYSASHLFYVRKTVKTKEGYEIAKEKERKPLFNRINNSDPKKAKKKRAKKHMSVSALKIYIMFAVVAVRVLSCLPELVYLDVSDAVGVVDQNRISPIHFKSLFVAFAAIPAFIIAFIAVKKFIRYIKCFMADRDFCRKLCDIYDEKLPATHKIFSYRRSVRVCWLLGIAAALSASFYLDEFDILPSILPAAIFLFAGIYMRIALKEGKATGLCVVSGIYTAVSALSLFLSIMFNKSYGFSAVGRVDEATELFNLNLLFIALSAFFFLLSVAVAVYAFTSYVKAELLEAEGGRDSHRGKDMFYEVRKLAIYAAVFAVPSAVSSVFNYLNLGDTVSEGLRENMYITNTNIYIPRVEWYWMADFALSICLFVAVLLWVDRIKTNLNRKYMID